jgi:hypothetical protein
MASILVRQAGTTALMLADPRYCYPLTITDFASRYLIRCEALSTTKELYAFSEASQTVLVARKHLGQGLECRQHGPALPLSHCPPRPDGAVAAGSARATISTASATRTATAMYCRPAFVYVTGNPVVGPGI